MKLEKRIRRLESKIFVDDGEVLRPNLEEYERLYKWHVAERTREEACPPGTYVPCPQYDRLEGRLNRIEKAYMRHRAERISRELETMSETERAASDEEGELIMNHQDPGWFPAKTPTCISPVLTGAARQSKAPIPAEKAEPLVISGETAAPKKPAQPPTVPDRELDRLFGRGKWR